MNLLCVTFGIFLENHFSRMIRNLDLHKNAIELLQLALQKKAESADKVIRDCEEVRDTSWFLDWFC